MLLPYWSISIPRELIKIPVCVFASIDRSWPEMDVRADFLKFGRLIVKLYPVSSHRNSASGKIARRTADMWADLVG